VIALALGVLLQAAPPAPPPPRPSRGDRLVASLPDATDETYPLDIASRRITRGPYRAGHALELSPATAGLAVRIGALLTAARIDVHLRNVRGTVRFRADLGPVRSVLRGGGRRPLEPGR
jgi:hypothetical protein